MESLDDRDDAFQEGAIDQANILGGLHHDLGHWES